MDCFAHTTSKMCGFRTGFMVERFLQVNHLVGIMRTYSSVRTDGMLLDTENFLFLLHLDGFVTSKLQVFCC